MNKLELVNEKVHYMELEIKQHKLNEQIMTRKIEALELRTIEKIEDVSINIQVV